VIAAIVAIFFVAGIVLAAAAICWIVLNLAPSDE